MKNSIVRYSKFLSLVLRHKPETIDICLDQNGWADVDLIIQGFNKKGLDLNFQFLKEVVDTNEKKRFAFNNDFTKIRANQGHSKQVDLNLKSIEPPDTLFHGTATRFWESISEKGLIKKGRQHVHLSKDKETAKKVGIRHGKLLILYINSKLMYQKGHVFFLSDNGVWLTDYVPVEFISKE